MKKIHGFFILLLLASSLTRADLLERVKEELQTDKTYPCMSQDCPPQEAVESFQFIFIGGFLSDQLKDVSSVSSVIKNKFKISDSFAIKPDSRNPIPKNANILYEQVLNLRAQSPHKKAIIFAFSKGGAETLLMVLQHPELVTSGLISDVVTINGALGGTPLADLWKERCAQGSTSQLPRNANICGTIRKLQGGVTSLRPEYIVPVINRALFHLSDSEREILGDSLWAVQSQWGDVKTERTSDLWATHLFLNRFGANDGAILTEDQRLPEGFGKNLGVFNFDHNALMKCSSSPAITRRNESFARALIREIIYNRTKIDSSILAKGLL